MAEDLIAGKAEQEEVAGNGIWRLAILRLLILVELSFLAFDLGPLAYVCTKETMVSTDVNTRGPWGGREFLLRVILTSEEPARPVLELDSAYSSHRSLQVQRLRTGLGCPGGTP